jgi:hypothetical protein
MIQSRLLASSDWLYRQLLRSYPAAFRDHFAADMALVFRAMCREAYAESGPGGLASLWLPVIWDWLWAALYQWELHLFKRRTEIMRINPINRSDGIPPLSLAHASLAVLPFLLFGLSSFVSKLDIIPIDPFSTPLAQILILNPFLLFNWLILVGLGISLFLDFPRWGYAYLGWAILFAWWWQGMGFYGYFLGGLMWLLPLGFVVIALLVRRSIQPLRALLRGLWQDLTLLAFALYILYSFVFMLYDENHNPYLLILITATTLAMSLGAWGYFRANSPLRRVLALIGGLLLATIISIIDNATWDFSAYYGLPEGSQNANLVGIIFFAILALLMVGLGLLAYWRHERNKGTSEV